VKVCFAAMTYLCGRIRLCGLNTDELSQLVSDSEPFFYITTRDNIDAVKYATSLLRNNIQVTEIQDNC
jgi:hypothetical protein